MKTKTRHEVIEIASDCLASPVSNMNGLNEQQGFQVVCDILGRVSNHLGPEHSVLVPNTWTMRENKIVLQSIELEWKHQKENAWSKYLVWKY